MKLEHLDSQLLIPAGLAAIRLYSRLYHRLRVVTPCPIPRRGPGILICNHISGLDPILLQSTTARLIHWMMAAEYFEIPVIGWGFEPFGVIPVRRSGRDMPAARAALRVLEAGGLIGVFPEGRLETGHELLPFHPGAAMLAARSGATIYPACIEGTQRGKPMLEVYLKRQSAVVAFGRPVCFAVDSGSELDLEEATSTLQQAVAGLKTEVTDKNNAGSRRT